MDTPFSERLIRAARLDATLYEEVEADETASPQAAAVVILSSVATGIGQGGLGIAGLAIGSLGALAAWGIWAALTWWIGTRLLPEAGTHATWAQLLRTIAFASAPGILRVLGIVPGLRGLVFLVTGVWMLVAMVIAVRQALDYQSTARAIGVCLVGWLVQLVILAVLLTAMAGSMPPA